LIRELKNYLTSAVASIISLLVFVLFNRFGLVYPLAGAIYKIKEILGLVHTDPLKGPYLPILGTNIMLFVLLNVIFGYLAYILINRRGANYHGVFYGMAMVVVFFIITFSMSVASLDNAASPISYIGTLLEALVQLPLSQKVIRR
jgi:hypothetical protein